MFDQNEIAEWETQIDGAKLQQHHGHEKVYFDPCFERLKKRRKNFKLSGLWRESTYNRFRIQNQFNMLMKSNIENEIYFRPCTHDYRTYGWETW